MLKRLAVASLLALLLPLHAAALENEDLLALVAMPLAVAAVSEMTDVPVNELIDVVTLLNDAAVPPVQFVEVVRYSPVALVVENDEPDFVEFIRVREQEGLRGTQLVTVIEEHIRTFGVPDVELDVTAPQFVVVDGSQGFIPEIVRTRVAEVKAHPHGGPPGQLKKERGLQTGAEVVHGTRPARVRAADKDDKDRGVVADSDRGRGRSKQTRATTKVRVEDNDDRGKEKNRGRGNSAHMSGNGNEGRGHSGHGGGAKHDGGKQGGGNDGGGQAKGKGKGKG